MHVVVNFVGLDREAVEKFAAGKELQHVVFTSVDEVNAAKFAVGEKAALTVMHYRNKTVAANHALAPGALDAAAIDAIVKSTEKILAADPSDKKVEKKNRKKGERKK